MYISHATTLDITVVPDNKYISCLATHSDLKILHAGPSIVTVFTSPTSSINLSFGTQGQSAMEGKECRAPMSLHLILGPMYSGKSTRLKQMVRRYLAAKMRCLTIKYQKDERYDKEFIATHDLEVLDPTDSAYGENVVVLQLSEIATDRLQHIDVIAIDEGQFFPDIYSVVLRWLVDLKKTVLVASLDGWHNLAPCDKVLNLIPLAMEVEKLTAICTTCYQDCASCTYRLKELDSDENVGGHELYEAACLPCHIAKTRAAMPEE